MDYIKKVSEVTLITPLNTLIGWRTVKQAPAYQRKSDEHVNCGSHALLLRLGTSFGVPFQLQAKPKACRFPPKYPSIIRHLSHSTKYLFLFMVFALLLATNKLTADTISTTDKYAWSENAGWLDFSSTHEQATVYNDHLEGYVWSEAVGWIRLGTYTTGDAHTYANNAANTYGVNNDGSGNLSGYGWGENIGWVNFNSNNSQVTINAVTGDFDGYAWSEAVGWIHFQNATPAYKVNRVIPDITPDAFSFTDQTNISLSTLTTSNSITVSGINTNAVISIIGGEYEINGNGTWLTANGVVANTDTVKVRHTSSGSYSTSMNSILNIGGVSDTFTTTTKAAPASAADPAPSSIPKPEIDKNLIPVAIDLINNGGLAELQSTFAIVGTNNAISLVQDVNTLYLQATIDERMYLLRPIKIESAPDGAEPGIIITADGLVQMVTEQGNLITALAEPQQLQDLTDVLQQMGFETEQQLLGLFKVSSIASNRADTEIWYASRAAYDSSPAESGAMAGLFAIASSDPINSVRYDYYFLQDEVLYYQTLYPTPANWESLKTYLSTLGTVSMDIEGFITLQTENSSYRAIMDYRVESTQLNGQFQLEPIDDANADGIGDYLVTYENGDKQILYLISVD